MASKSLNADGFVSFGDFGADVVSRVVFQIRDDGILSTSAVPKGRVRGLADAELKALPYVNRNDPDTQIAAGTAITAEGIYEVDSTGLETGLDNNWTSGAGSVHYQHVAG